MDGDNANQSDGARIVMRTLHVPDCHATSSSSKECTKATRGRNELIKEWTVTIPTRDVSGRIGPDDGQTERASCKERGSHVRNRLASAFPCCAIRGRRSKECTKATRGSNELIKEWTATMSTRDVSGRTGPNDGQTQRASCKERGSRRLEGVYSTLRALTQAPRRLLQSPGVDGDNSNQRSLWQGRMMVKPKERAVRS